MQSLDELGFSPICIPTGQLTQKRLKTGGIGTDRFRLSLPNIPQFSTRTVDASAAPKSSTKKVGEFNEVSGSHAPAGLQQRMPPVRGSILQQSGRVCHLLDVTSVRQVEEILDFRRPGGDVILNPPAKYRRVFRLHLYGERLTRSLLLVGASIGREWGWRTTSVRATVASSSTNWPECDIRASSTVHSVSIVSS